MRSSIDVTCPMMPQLLPPSTSVFSPKSMHSHPPSSSAMKRAAPSSSSSSSPVNASALSLDSLPRHHYSLGEDVFVKVTDFTSTIRIHIRTYSKDDDDFYHPTKMGITMSATAFCEFKDSVYNIHAMTHMQILSKELLISRQSSPQSSPTSGSSYTFQQLLTTSNGSHRLNPIQITLNYYQFQTLSSICNEIWSDVEQLIFGPTFRQLVLQQSANQKKKSFGNTDQLTSTLVKVLKELIVESDSPFISCSECAMPIELQCNNQLAHNCLTFYEDDKFKLHFNISLATISPKLLATRFVTESSMVIPIEFLNSIIVKDLLETVKTT